MFKITGRGWVAGALALLMLAGTASTIEGCATSGSGSAATTTTTKPFDKTVFCAAVKALAGGTIPADHDVAVAHERVNALGASIPDYLKDEIPQIMDEYNAVIDAYAANNFDTAAVLANGSDQVKATLSRLAREAHGEDGLEPEAALNYEAIGVCQFTYDELPGAESVFSSVGAPVN